MFVKYPLFIADEAFGSGKPFLVTRTIFGSQRRNPRSLPLMADFVVEVRD
jgi:hypothetical protein